MSANKPSYFLGITFFTLILTIFLLHWLRPQTSFAQSAQRLEAHIGTIEVDHGRDEVLRIVGTASGREFSEFQIEFGMGEFPKTWNSLARSKRPVHKALLAVWKTADLITDTYGLRLTVRDQAGRRLSDRMVIKLADFRPDLVIGGLEARMKDSQVMVRATLENLGRQPVRKPFSVDFFLSTSRTTDRSSIHLAGDTISLLEAKGQVPLKNKITILPRVKNGHYFLIARVDTKNKVVEVQEDNNLAIAPSRMVLSPDLIVTKLKSELVRDGQEITASGIVKNQGNRPANKSVSLLLFLSSDGVVDDRDLRIYHKRIAALKVDSTTSFSLNFPLPETLAPGNYYILAQLDPEERIYEVDRANNFYWGKSLTLGPDPVVSALSVTVSENGSQIIVTDRVKNQSRYAVYKPFKISYFLVSNQDVSSSSGMILGNREIPQLAAGEVSKASTPFPVTSFTTGSYIVLAKVDPEKVLEEMNRNNNEYRGGRIEIGPDIAFVRFSAGLLPDGEQIEATDTVKNQGNLPVADSFRVAYYLSMDDQLDKHDPLLGSRSIKRLGVGSESSEKTLLLLPPKAKAGEAFILARVDPEGTIREININNNIISSGRILKNDVDLTVSLLTATLLSDGKRMVLRDTVKNLGPQHIPGPFNVTFYLSRDGVIDPNDLLLGERNIEGLKAGLDSSGTTALVIPEKVSVGKLSVLARVDSLNKVVERKETNNDYWGSSLHFGPDLILTELKGEVSPDAREIVITHIIRNQGNRAAGGFKVGVFLSKDSRIDPDDVALGIQPMMSLLPGQSTTLKPSFLIPASIPNGHYYLLGSVDTDKEEEEVDEGNNGESGGNVLLGPDLVVEAIKSTLSPEGDRILVQDTVRNQGNRPVSVNLEVSYVLSKNWSIDGSDIFLGSRAINVLGAGESSVASTALTIPKKEVSTGRYFVLAKVDGANTVNETDEKNNVRPTLVPLVIRQEKE